MGRDSAVNKTLLGVASVASFVIGAVVVSSTAAGARQGTVREFTIRADQYAFAPSRIEVQKDDIVKVTFTAVDIPHSFTMDGAYRIAKRANAGQTVTFEFRASGSERFYCNLSQDERCTGMHGELVVK
jgi:plastocyanin